MKINAPAFFGLSFASKIRIVCLGPEGVDLAISGCLSKVRPAAMPPSPAPTMMICMVGKGESDGDVSIKAIHIHCQHAKRFGEHFGSATLHLPCSHVVRMIPFRKTLPQCSFSPQKMWS